MRDEGETVEDMVFRQWSADVGVEGYREKILHEAWRISLNIEA